MEEEKNIQNPKKNSLLDLVEQSRVFMSSIKYQKLTNGETLAYRSLKSSKSQSNILLIHGNITSSDTYDTLAVLLQPYFNVFAVDLRMLGDSTYNNPITSVQDWVNDLKLFVDEIGLKKFILAGLSLGGAVAQAFTCHYQTYVEYLILLGSVGPSGYPIFKADDEGNTTDKKVESVEELVQTPQWKPLIQKINEKDFVAVKGFFDMLAYNNNSKPEPEERYLNLCKSAVKQKDFAQAMFILNKFNLTEIKTDKFGRGYKEIDKIICPVIVLQGQNDIIVPQQFAEEIVKEVGENAKLEIIQNAGHIFFLESYEFLLETCNHIVQFCKNK